MLFSKYWDKGGRVPSAGSKRVVSSGLLFILFAHASRSKMSSGGRMFSGELISIDVLESSR